MGKNRGPTRFNGHRMSHARLRHPCCCRLPTLRMCRGGVYAYYNCYNRTCSHRNVHVSSAKLGGQFAAMLGGAGLGEKAIERVRKLVTERLHIRSAATKDQTERFTHDVARLETQTQCLLEMRLRGEVSVAEFAAQKKRIESELATAHAGAARQADVSREFDVDTAFDEAKAILADPARFWQELSDVAHKREFQKVVFKSHPSYNPTKESFGTPEFSRVFRVFDGSDLTNLQNVAGPGFEPGTRGYEPCMMPFHYPAMYSDILVHFLQKIKHK